MEIEESNAFEDLPWLKSFCITLYDNTLVSFDTTVNTSLDKLTRNEGETVAKAWMHHWVEMKMDPEKAIDDYVETFPALQELTEDYAFFLPWMRTVALLLKRENRVKKVLRIRLLLFYTFVGFFFAFIILEFFGCRLGCCWRGTICPRSAPKEGE